MPRIFVPKDLQAAAGKDEIHVSLKTADATDAKRRPAPVLDQWSATWDDMRRRQTLTEDDLQTAAWDHYTGAMIADDKACLARPTPADLAAAYEQAVTPLSPYPGGSGEYDPINRTTEYEIIANRVKWATRRNAARLARLRSDLATSDTRLIEPDADAFLSRHSFKIDKGDPRYRQLCLTLMRAEIEHLERYAEREQGDLTGKPGNPIIAAPAVRTDASRNVAPAETIMGMFAKYERENPNDIQADSLKPARRDVQNFADFAGPRARPSKITKAMVGEWHDLLVEYPVKATETTIFKGLSPQEIVAKNKTLAKPKATLTRQTVRRYVGSLSGFCRWLVRRDMLAANPVADMMPKKGGPPTSRDVQ